MASENLRFLFDRRIRWNQEDPELQKHKKKNGKFLRALSNSQGGVVRVVTSYINWGLSLHYKKKVLYMPGNVFCALLDMEYDGEGPKGSVLKLLEDYFHVYYQPRVSLVVDDSMISMWGFTNGRHWGVYVKDFSNLLHTENSATLWVEGLGDFSVSDHGFIGTPDAVFSFEDESGFIEWALKLGLEFSEDAEESVIEKFIFELMVRLGVPQLPLALLWPCSFHQTRHEWIEQIETSYYKS